MDKLFDILRPALPTWIIVPGTALLMVLGLWPTLRDIWQATVPWNRSYLRDRRRLELIKLQLEVRALAKQVDPALFARIDAELSRPERPAEADLGRRRRFLWGAAAGALVWAGSILVTPHILMLLSDATIGAYVGVAIRGVIFALLGGTGALLARARTVQDSLIYGAVGPLAVLIFALALSPASTGGRIP
ncbi:MAG: hypothetical protein IT561_03450 [Alphaproteobacteria bacterium]|nr:hypothetical protein [Alphaproteobacteria bacterium]